MKSIKKLIWQILRGIGLSGIVALIVNSYLKDKGWFLTHTTGKSTDKNGNPIPWFTYPSIDFLVTRLTNDMNIFEYGCGSSTLWFSNKVKKIASVEHHKGWFETVREKLPKNSEVILRENETEYAQSVKNTKEKYDVIIIDGIVRNECITYSIPCLSDKGVLILDNSERKDYETGTNLLIQHGFRRIDFYGMSPVISTVSCTSIFYKDSNCLKI